MAKKQKVPFMVTVGGVRRRVVHMTNQTWTEQESSGRLVHHMGKLLLEGQTPTKLIDKPRPCSKCKQPTITTTMRGRPIHDTCEGWLNVMPDELEAQVIFGIAVDLGATIVTPKEDQRRARRAA